MNEVLWHIGSDDGKGNVSIHAYGGYDDIKRRYENLCKIKPLFSWVMGTGTMKREEYHVVQISTTR